MPFEFEKTPFEGIVAIRIKSFEDNRGSFAELYKKSDFYKAGINSDFTQENISISCSKTLRGMHWQAYPHSQAKLVYCLSGNILDVVTDLRPTSKTFLKTFMIKLSPCEGFNALYIPEGFAHGFAAFTQSAVLYRTTGEYCPQAERGFRYDDPLIAIPWDLPFTPILSKKDNERKALSKDFPGDLR